MINKKRLYDVITYTYDNGFLSIVDGDMSLGCVGVVCQISGIVPKQFYFDSFANNFSSAEEYLKEIGREETCREITATLSDMALSSTFIDEAIDHFLDIAEFCASKGMKTYAGFMRKTVETLSERIEKDELF